MKTDSTDNSLNDDDSEDQDYQVKLVAPMKKPT
jgi:hypothetical protein